MQAVCFFATGFEEVEAIATCNLLKRAGIGVTMVGLDSLMVESARGITIQMDCCLSDWEPSADCLILPGGLPGSDHLHDSTTLKRIVQAHHHANKLIAALCAAPVVILDKWGMLSGKTVTCYTDLKTALSEGCYLDADVVRCGNIITSRGVGTVLEFGLTIIDTLCGPDTAATVKHTIGYTRADAHVALMED